MYTQINVSIKPNGQTLITVYQNEQRVFCVASVSNENTIGLINTLVKPAVMNDITVNNTDALRFGYDLVDTLRDQRHNVYASFMV